MSKQFSKGRQSFPFYRIEDMGPEKPSDLPKVMQLDILRTVFNEKRTFIGIL